MAQPGLRRSFLPILRFDASIAVTSIKSGEFRCPLHDLGNGLVGGIPPVPVREHLDLDRTPEPGVLHRPPNRPNVDEATVRHAPVKTEVGGFRKPVRDTKVPQARCGSADVARQVEIPPKRICVENQAGCIVRVPFVDEVECRRKGRVHRAEPADRRIQRLKTETNACRPGFGHDAVKSLQRVQAGGRRSVSPLPKPPGGISRLSMPSSAQNSIRRRVDSMRRARSAASPIAMAPPTQSATGSTCVSVRTRDALPPRQPLSAFRAESLGSGSHSKGWQKGCRKYMGANMPVQIVVI